MLLAAALLVAGAVDQNSAALVTELVTTALGNEQRFDVISSADVRRQLEIEANKQTLGCDASASSCLAEIAGAMGAQLVVYGKLGTLDDIVVLTLNVFDSQQGRAVGRVAVRESSLKALSERVDGAVKELTAPYVKQLAEGARSKLLVLDIEPPKKGEPLDVPPAPPPSDPPSALFWGGVGGLAGGVIVAGVGAVLLAIAFDRDKQADNEALSAVDALDRYTERDNFGAGALIGVSVGVLAAVGGAVLLVSDSGDSSGAPPASAAAAAAE